MKKLFSLILTLIMVLTISITCFAASEDSANDAIDFPGAARNVSVATYDEESTDPNNQTISPELIEIEEKEIPAGLPNTGGIPAEAFYVAGAMFVVAALILALKKNKAGQNN